MRQLLEKEKKTITLEVKRYRPERKDFVTNSFKAAADRFTTVLDALLAV